MKDDGYLDMRECVRALEYAASDLFAFAVICMGGVEDIAEQIIADVLLLGLERRWFVEDPDYSHREYREEFFREVWSYAERAPTQVRGGADVPLGHEEMLFYKLPQATRAALYLRTKRKFSYESIARILGNLTTVRDDVEKARAFLLGRAPRNFLEEGF